MFSYGSEKLHHDRPRLHPQEYHGSVSADQEPIGIHGTQLSRIPEGSIVIRERPSRKCGANGEVWPYLQDPAMPSYRREQRSKLCSIFSLASRNICSSTSLLV